MQDAYTAQEIATKLGISRQAVVKRAKKEGWEKTKRSRQRPYVAASLPEDVRVAIQTQHAPAVSSSPSPAPSDTQCFVPALQDSTPLADAEVPDKERQKALARADVVRLYTQALAKAGKKRKTQARREFELAFKNGNWPQLLKTLGPVSWKSIERWKLQIREAGDPLKLADRRGRHRRGSTSVSQEQAEILLRCALMPNRPKISQAIRMARSVMQHRGIQDTASETTYRRFLDRWIETNWHMWVWQREGAKAWNDKCAYFVSRNMELLNVGDIVVADGHVVNFEVINPFTGQAHRPMLILWYDMASNYPLGWDLMPTENTGAICAALRRAILRLGKMPRIAYLDNGKAFKSKFFTERVDFEQAGLGGLFGRLGIETIFAWAYHGQSKTVERFFGTFQEMEVWMPSYVGRNIETKPARMKRGERLHRKVYEGAGCQPLTMDEAHRAIAAWFDTYAQRPQRGHLKGRTPLEVFEAGRGPGIEAPEQLRELMMAATVRTIHRNGIQLMGERYYDPMLYGRKHSCHVRYDMQDRGSVLVYDRDWQFICEAQRVQEVHPAARLMGSDEDRDHLSRNIDLKKAQSKQASSMAREFLEQDVMPEYQRTIERMGVDSSHRQQQELPEAEPESGMDQEQYDALIQRLETQRANRAPYDRPEFNDELSRYEHLFKVRHEQDIALLDEDEQWMERFEQTEQYRINARRYEQLKRTFAALKKKAVNQ